MFRRRLSRLRTASLVIFVASIVYFIEYLLRHMIFNSTWRSEIDAHIHRNSRILLYRLTESKFNVKLPHKRRELEIVSQNTDEQARPSCDRTAADYFDEVVDSQGRICQSWNLTAGGCCGSSRLVVGCTCCERYNDCVAGCISYPNKYASRSRVELEKHGADNDEFFRNLPVAFLREGHFASLIYTEFDMCKTVCRTNSGSIEAGNVYKPKRRHCYLEPTNQ